MRASAADETAHAAELDAAIDEILRIDDPFPANRRVTTADVEVGDAVIPSGSRVELDWIAANRDADVFGDPDEFRPEANAAANLVYGTGPHVCPGRLISTIEIRCAIAALLRATGSFRLDGDRPSEREERPAGGWRTSPRAGLTHGHARKSGPRVIPGGRLRLSGDRCATSARSGARQSGTWSRRPCSRPR